MVVLSIVLEFFQLVRQLGRRLCHLWLQVWCSRLFSRVHRSIVRRGWGRLLDQKPLLGLG